VSYSRGVQRPLTVALGIAAAGLLWTGGQALQASALEDRARWPRSEDLVLLPPPELAPIVYLGYREAAADVTWSRALVYYGSTKAEGSDYRYLEKFVDNVIALDPRFKRVYRWAAYAVTFKEDVAKPEEFRKSLEYLEKGMAEFPDDYELFWIAGMRYYLDLRTDDDAERQRNKEHGAELIERAMRKPNAPPDLATLAATFRTRIGQKERAIRELREMILVTDNEKAQEKMVDRLRTLMAEGDAALVDEMLRAKVDFEARWQADMPWVPRTLYLILGPTPPAAIDLAALAVDRDLIGSQDDEGGEGGDDDDSAAAAEPPPEPAHLDDRLGDDAGVVHAADAGAAR
jgi:tetratricopeptide (TPR) repeat protein